MNVNLMQFSPWVVNQGESPTPLMQQLTDSAKILGQHEDTRPLYAPVLLPDYQRQYPGSYQVWFPVNDGWVYINPEGMIIRMDSLPNHNFFKADGQDD